MSKQSYTVNIAKGKTSESMKLTQDQFKVFSNLKIGSQIAGSVINEKYETEKFIIKGGSTKTGTPLYRAIVMPRYIKTKYKQNIKKGIQKKKRVYGNQITSEVVAVDLAPL